VRVATFRGLDHVLRAIDTGHVAGASEESRERQPAAEPDVEHVCRGLEIEEVDRPSVEIAVAAVHQGGDESPAGAGRM
jgi:hypothetical protein